MIEIRQTFFVYLLETILNSLLFQWVSSVERGNFSFLSFKRERTLLLYSIPGAHITQVQIYIGWLRAICITKWPDFRFFLHHLIAEFENIFFLRKKTFVEFYTHTKYSDRDYCRHMQQKRRKTTNNTQLCLYRLKVLNETCFFHWTLQAFSSNKKKV